jgi:protein-S-isoprenylcysteine O-methyltransferase Ste14
MWARTIRGNGNHERVREKVGELSTLLLKVIYLAGIVLEIIIRVPYRTRTRQNKITDMRMDAIESVVLLLFLVGNVIVPGLFILTPWLDFANYQLPDWAGWLGVALMVGVLFVFWRAHIDLGLNWSATLAMREGHNLVTQGIYAYIRHPMYASQWLWILAQPLLLQNWIAGFAGILGFLPMYFLRVPREEKMMLDHFGDEYRAYMQRTGAVLPRFPRNTVI